VGEVEQLLKAHQEFWRLFEIEIITIHPVINSEREVIVKGWKILTKNAIIKVKKAEYSTFNGKHFLQEHSW